MLACGRSCTSVVSKEGHLYVWGHGPEGQLGVDRLPPVSTLFQQPVYHTDDDGRPYFCSDAHRCIDARAAHRLPARVDFGSIGMPGTPNLPASTPIRMVACGTRHQAAVTEDGTLLTCGDGREGQLGRLVFVPNDGTQHEREQSWRMTPVVALGAPFVDDFAGAPVLSVACGHAHTMAVTTAGLVFTCGANDHGQLGLGNRESRHLLAQVAGPTSIAMAACGSEHSIVVSSEGRVWSWGKGGGRNWGIEPGEFGVHGHYDSDDRLSPSVLQAPEEFASSTIVMVSAGEYHTVAVGECGAVWSWGVGSTGQLGLGSLFTAPLPTLVGAEDVFGGSKPHLAVCGSCHTLVVTEAGAVWACGQGGSGALGLNDSLPRFVPTRIDQKRFAHARVVTLAAGDCHSAAVTHNGALFTWGRGKDHGVHSGGPGGLGHADQRNRLVPAQVSPDLLHGPVGRCLGLADDYALAFAMGTHSRLGAGTTVAGGSRRKQGGSARRNSKRKVAGRGLVQGSFYSEMPADLVRKIVKACDWKLEGETGQWAQMGEGMARLGAGPQNKRLVVHQ